VAVCNPQVDPNTNKLIGYQFDSSGNTKTDASGQTFIYDAENKQVEVRNASNAVVGQYFYDGDGKRVKKIVPSTGETTIFVYDAGGKMVAEYSTIVATPTNAKISYLTSDHLGSPRINTDANGQVIARHDYQPFGEEITRASYGADSTRQKFTSYERDIESSLDYAEARYYGYNQGRFSSPDPMMASARRRNPQTFNRYSYVLNNPLNLVDPFGLAPCPPGQECWKDEDGTEHTDDEPIRVENSQQSVPGCGGVPCSDTPPAAGLVGPVPSSPLTVPPEVAPIVAPGVGRIVLSTAGRMVVTTVALPLAVILALPSTANPNPECGTRCEMEKDKTKTTTEDDKRRRSITVWHYTTNPNLTGSGLLPGSSATDNPNYTSESASQLYGIPPPTLVYPVTYDPVVTPMRDESPVGRGAWGPGGGTDFYFPLGTPTGSIGPPRPVPSGLKPR
jgi:RHS repeat-associated protein